MQISKTDIRWAEDFEEVWLDPKKATSAPIYWIYYFSPESEHKSLLEESNLVFNIAGIPPCKVGKEYLKDTRGHYHHLMPDSPLAYPEVYTNFCGHLQYLIQKLKSFADIDNLEEFILFGLQAGESLIIPPGYAHFIITPTNEVSVMAGLWCNKKIQDPALIIKMKCVGYYLIEECGNSCFIPTPSYRHVPSFRKQVSLENTLFQLLVKKPLWSSFVENPEQYMYLMSSRKAKRIFASQSIRTQGKNNHQLTQQYFSRDD
jgi:oxalate decarboxylase/phosphoglucose isomerase-like protein (cupin superfamily)